MSSKIVPQDEVEVKCFVGWCHEAVFRDGLCWDHFIEEVNAKWDAQDAERQAALEGIGLVCGPALDGGWWGDPLEEVYR
jgi:hypothetical protein